MENREKRFTVLEALPVFSGGAGRDRTDDLMNAIFSKGGSVKNITYSNDYAFRITWYLQSWLKY
jgi:hypothetical protein